jgi:aminopeptidase YwaD
MNMRARSDSFIIGEKMPNINLEVMSYIEKLVVEIGPRLIGSPANQAAADFIRDTFLSAGLQVEEQPFPCTAWEVRAALFEADSVPLPVEANVFSPACNVHGELLSLGTIPELERADLDGKIVLFYGELASTQISPKSWFLRGPDDEKIFDLLVKGKPSALLAPPCNSSDYEQVTEDWDLPIPAATLPREVVLQLLREPPLSVHLKLECANTPSTARNIVARKPSPSPVKVVLCAHFDTFHNTPGALDNGASAGALLALAGDLAFADLPFGLEFVAFNGEEALPMGDDEYLRSGEGDLGNILLAINMDDMGAWAGSNSLAVFSASDALFDFVDEVQKKYPGIVRVDPWPESNHSTFSMRGVPSLAFSSIGIRHLAHTPADSIEQVSPKKVGEVIDLIKDIVRGLAGKSPDWSRPKE